MQSLEERNSLIESHLRLASKLARMASRKTSEDFDELQSVAWLALTIAARDWNPERAAFSSFAWRCIQWQLWGHIRARRQMVSLSEPVADGVELGDAIKSTDPGPDAAVGLNEMLAVLPARDRRVIEDRLAGETLGEIAGRRGCSKQNIHVAVKRSHWRLIAHFQGLRTAA